MQPAIIDLILRQTPNGAPEAGIQDTSLIPMKILRSDRESGPRPAHYVPALCLCVQGEKELVTASQTLIYSEMQYLLIRMDVPAIGRVRSASPDKPFLGVAIGIDLEVLREVLESLGTPLPSRAGNPTTPKVCPIELEVVDCIYRMLKLLDRPEAAKAIYPLIAREMYYWLLTGPNREAVTDMAMPNPQMRSIASSIHAIRTTLDRPMSVDQLAELVSMSPSSFHAHFKAATSMTPVQFQKRLRLLEARRLLKGNLANATEAAVKVGYESLSQFSRDYSNFFGAPPRRDLALSS